MLGVISFRIPATENRYEELNEWNWEFELFKRKCCGKLPVPLETLYDCRIPLKMMKMNSLPLFLLYNRNRWQTMQKYTISLKYAYSYFMS